jgi:hypothetical protein
MMENTSGQGPTATVPAEIDRWNWGAFFLNWIWGIGNNTFIALLMFVPMVNVVMAFVLGAKGSAWAWRNKRWDSVGHFKATQRRWAQWGVGLFLASIAIGVAAVVGLIATMKNTDAYKLAAQRLAADARVTQLVGQPISTGLPSGSIETSGNRGSASLSFSVEGPKGKGTAYVEAIKDLGEWKIQRMAFEDEGTGRRIDLAPGVSL